MDDFKCNTNEVYTKDDMMDDLESIRAILKEAKRKINREKLEKTKIDIHYTITL